jgi:hypothetical protein
MGKKATAKQCMDFANNLLKNKSQVDALREAGLATGNENYDYKKASMMVRFSKVQEILDECEAQARLNLNITAASVITQYLSLMDSPDITVKDKIAIWDKVAGLLGLNRVITENTNIETITDEDRTILLQIRAELERGKTNDT